MKYFFILAKTPGNGIGYKGNLPWKLRNEMKYFQRMTKDVTDSNHHNAVIMGRLTWESMPDGFKPLSERINIVVSSKKLELKGAIHCYNLQEVSDYLNTNNEIETAWVIGGSFLYESCMKEGLCDRIYQTNILKDFPCDTFVNIDVQNGFKEIIDPRVPTETQEEDGVQYDFKVYEKV